MKFSWKWFSFGLLYAMLAMSLLGKGISPEAGNHLMSGGLEYATYEILTYGWGNLTILTAMSVAGFTTFPWWEQTFFRNIRPVAYVLILALGAGAIDTFLGSLRVVTIGYAEYAFLSALLIVFGTCFILLPLVTMMVNAFIRILGAFGNSLVRLTESKHDCRRRRTKTA